MPEPIRISPNSEKKLEYIGAGYLFTAPSSSRPLFKHFAMAIPSIVDHMIDCDIHNEIKPECSCRQPIGEQYWEFHCSCEGWQYTKHCWHIDKFQQALAENGELTIEAVT